MTLPFSDPAVVQRELAEHKARKQAKADALKELLADSAPATDGSDEEE